VTALEARDLTCAYDSRCVLADLSLATCTGQVLALIGPNGAGKTTLLRALARLLKPQSGVVLLADRNLWKLTSRSVARHLALAPQAAGMDWPLTVEQVVQLGRSPHRGWLLPFSADDWEAVERALEETGLQNLRSRKVTDLSGGEQRRVILARTLAQEPKVLLLDEPTAFGAVSRGAGAGGWRPGDRVDAGAPGGGLWGPCGCHSSPALRHTHGYSGGQQSRSRGFVVSSK